MSGIIGATTAAIQSALVVGAIGIGLNAAASLLKKKPSLNQSTLDRLQTTVDPTAARKIVFGLTAAGADVRFEEQYGSAKDAFVQIVALASHKIHSFQSFYANDDQCWANGNFTGTDRGGFNSLTPVLEGTSSNGFAVGSGQYWTSADTFTGCAYVAVDYHLSNDVWSTPPSRTVSIVEGCAVYDVRLDSTNGGSGSHRPNDQTTWAYNANGIDIGRNPALCLLTYLLGYKINGKLVWGMGIPANRINYSSFITYANLCESQVTTATNGTVQRYTLDCILATSDSHETNLGIITGAMGTTRLTDVGGLYGLIGGYDDTLDGPIVAFDESDFVSGLSWKVATSARDTHNSVAGRFADASNQYQLNSWGQIETDPLADGVQRTLTLDLPGVTRAESCQRIAKQFLLKDALTPGVLAATFGPKAFLVQVGDLCTISHPDQGWNNKLFRVIESAESHDLIFKMTLQEESAAVYAWDREEKPLPASIRPPPYDPTTTITPSGLAATSSSYEGANRINVSEVTVTWSPESSGRVLGIQIESKLHDSDSWGEASGGLFDATAGTFTFASNAPGVSVDIRARYRMSTGVYSPWVTTSVDTAAIILQPDWSNTTNDTGTRPDDNATNSANPSSPFGTGTVGTTVSTIVSQGARLSTVETTTADSASRVTTLEAQSTTLQNGLTNADGRISNLETVTTNGTFATASTAANLEASMNSADTRISTVETATTDGRFASSSDLSTLEAAVGTADGRISNLETITTDGTFATATDRNNLQASIDSADTRLNNLETVTTNGTFASASDLSTLGSTVGGLSSTISSQATTISTISGTVSTQGSNLSSLSGTVSGQASDIATLNGQVGTQATTISTLDSTVSGISSTLTTQATTLTTLSGYADTRLVTTAVAGSGRAQIELYANSNGGGGVDIVGDVAIHGSLLVDDGVTLAKLARTSMTASQTGSYSGSYSALSANLSNTTTHKDYVPSLGNDMAVDGGSFWITYSGAVIGSNSPGGANAYASIDFLDTSNNLLAEFHLPYSQSGGAAEDFYSLRNYTIPAPNEWGATTIRWRLGVTYYNGSADGNSDANCLVTNPNIRIYWSAF